MATVVGGLFDSARNAGGISQHEADIVSSILDRFNVVEDLVARVTDKAATLTGSNNFVLVDNPEGAAITGSDGTDMVVGASGNDSFVGGAGDDTQMGGAGSDSIIGGEGNDINYGGEGDDIVTGGLGDDAIYGNQGNDTISSAEGNDTFFGGQGDDQVSGGADSDVLFGNKGADIVYGNTGADIVYGNQENDTLYGGQDSDVLFGGQGDDRLVGGVGDDTLHGNLGNDVYVIQGNGGADVVYFGEGDTIEIASNLNGLTLNSVDQLAERISEISGNAVIDLGNGHSVTVVGLTEAELKANLASYVSIV